MSPKLFCAAGVLSFAALLSPALNAAGPAQTQAPKVQPHNHMHEKTGLPVRVPDQKQAAVKKPLHDHGKFHKQQ